MQRAQEPVDSSGAPPSALSSAHSSAASSAESSAGPSPDYRMVADKKLARRSPGGRLGLVALIVPALLAAGGGILSGASAERALEGDAVAALRSEGLRGVQVRADGPFVTALVPTKVDPLRVGDVVEGVPGVSAVSTEEVFGSKKEARACANLGAKLDRATGKQRIPFAGRTPTLTSTGRQMVEAAAELVAACGSARVYVGAHTDPSTPQGSTLTIKRARAMIALMRRAGAPQERLVPRGYGAQYPVDDADTAAAKQRNERGSVTMVEG